MKLLLVFVSLLSLLSIGVSCNKNSTDQDRGIQREEAMDSDDFRETDSYDEFYPAQEEKNIQDDQDLLNSFPNDSTVAD